MSKKMPHSSWTNMNTNLLTTQFGRLTPFYFQPIVPGDRLRLSSSFTVQLQPLLAPAFQDLQLYVHYYYVPSRILYRSEPYNAFISREQRELYQQPKPIQKSHTSIGDLVRSVNRVFHNQSSGSVVPYDFSGHAFDGLLPDYLRIQLDATGQDFSNSGDAIIIEPFVAMFKIFLDHYASTLYPTRFVESTAANGGYNFQSYSYDELLYIYSYLQQIGFDNAILASSSVTLPDGRKPFILDILVQCAHVMYGRKGDIFMEAYPAAETQPSEPVGNTIETLRLASAMQRYKERKARVGHGVAEFLWEFFHVKNSDSRLQRSTFIGGGRMPINIDDVPQTSESTQNSALAELGGNAYRKGSFGFGRRYFEEYGYVFGLCYFVPKQAYYNGFDRLWKYMNPDDLYLEAFDSIGDEPIYQHELSYSGSTTSNNIIGYMPRYMRYKRAKNEIHGDFRNSLLYWHQSRNFGNTARLDNIRQVWANGSGLNRIFNYTGFPSAASEQPIMIYTKNIARWRRKMRYMTRPSLS